jgi:hypothetical protein
VYCEVLYCYDSYQVGKLSPCYVRNDVCNVIDVIYYFIIQTVGPPIFMITFGIGTFFHIRQRRQVLSTLPARIELVQRTPISTINTENAERNGEKHVLSMLTIQVAIYLICSIPLLSTKIYQNIPLSIVKSDVRDATEALFQLVYFTQSC